MTNPTPTPGAAAELPVVAWSGIDGRWLRQERSAVSRIALTPQAPAQSQLDALRAEVERLTKERDKLEFAMGGWKEMLWAVARELNCLPSTFWDGNAHVLKAAIKLNAELAALKAHPTDVDALMALADAYTRAVLDVVDSQASDVPEVPEREALRTALAARKELT